MNEEVAVAIRSVGERTETICHHLISQQVPLENIVVIREIPFSAAVAKTFEFGLDYSLPWTLAVDADLLIKQNTIKQLLALAAQADKTVFKISGSVLDKFFGGPRLAGIHLYRTSLLPQAVAFVSSTDIDISMRPETFVLREMEKRGYAFILLNPDIVLGLHDYEQFYQDIYRKTFVHAHKHHRYAPYLKSYWKRMAGRDSDFQIGLWGLGDGLKYKETVKIDVRQFSSNRMPHLLSQRHWQEKEPLSPTEMSAKKINQIADEWCIPAEYWFYQYLKGSYKLNWNARIRTLLKRVGWVQTASFLKNRAIRHALRVVNR